MSEHDSLTAAAGDSVTLETGLEALQSSPEFSGLVEELDGHHCNDHFAHIYESRDEKFAAAVPFAQHGLERGERVMYVVDESTEAEVTSTLRDAGINVDAALTSGALTFHTVDETYLRNGSFDVDEMIEFYGDTVAEATDEFEALRIIAEMTWLEDDATTVEQFMEYEQKVNKLFSETDSLAICQYNRDRFAPDTLRNVVRTHPHLIYDGAVCHNFYYTPPEEFFGTEDPISELDRMLGTLRDRTVAKATLQRREQYQQQLYEITADSERSFDEKIRRLLELGTERFDLEIGYFARTPDDNTFEIVNAVGPHEQIQPGVTDSLSDTYCEKLLASPAPISVQNAAEVGWTDDPAYDRFGLDAYFATTVHVGGEEYGTLCFASETLREESYTDDERTFLDLMGQWMGDELERHRRERSLRQSYEITSDPSLSFEEKLQALFDLGCEQFGLELGAMAKVDPDADRFEVEYVSNDHEHFEPGLDLPLSETYCTAATDARGVGSVDDPVEAGYDDIYVHNEFGIKAYLGTYIEVEGDLNRTFFFVSEEPRPGSFSDDEQTFQRLMGQWIKYELERQRREEFLRECYQITSDPDRSFEAKLEQLLELGRQQFGLDIGGIAKIDPETDYFEVETVSGNHDLLVPGEQYPLSETYCQLVTEDGETAAVTDPIDAGYEDKLCYDRFGVQSYLGTHLEVDGEMDRTFWFLSTELRETPITDEEQTFVDLMGQWVEYELERRQRERKLERTKTRFETVFEQSNDGIFLIDPDADDLIDVNPAAAEMTGYTRDELASLGPSDLHPDEMEQFRAFLDEVREIGSGWSEDFHCRHKDGRDIPAEITASTITLDGRDLVLTNVRPVEDRKTHERYQRELYDIVADTRASFDEKLNRLLELGRERFGVENGYFNRVDVSDDEFEVVAANGPHNMIEPGAVDSLSGTFCETHLDSSDPLAVEDVCDAGLDYLRAHDEYGLEAYFAATVRVGGDEYGTLCFASETARGTPFTEAERTFLDLMAQCVSYELERNHREGQLERKNDRLESFASLLAHELRNPVTIGQIYSKQLQGAADAEAVEYVTEAFDRIEDMIDVLLILTRGREAVSERTPVNLADVARKAWDTIEAPDAGLNLELNQTIEADETYIRHLFWNLLENAVEHGGADVTVTIGDLDDGFYVADDGTGIPPEERDEVFNEGYTTAADNGGTGLGLAFVQKLAEVYEWDITITESEDGGARFEFRDLV